MSDAAASRGRIRSRQFDIGLVVFLTAAGLFEAFLRPEETGGVREADPWLAIAIAAIMIPLLWRRRWPIQAMAASGICFFAVVLLGYGDTSAADSAQLIAIYSVGAYAARPVADRARWVTIVVLIGMLLWSHGVGAVSYFEVTLMFVSWVGAAILGETVFIRRRYQISLEERARLLEAERDERARLAVQDERARISRELHDVWAHTLSLVVVQAGAAQEVFDESPELARESLARIQQAARQALSEIRRLIGTDSGPGFDRSPAPRLGDIPRLVEELRRAGVPVELSITGPVERLPDDVGLSAYRIVQQALTNTLTHGGPGASASVEVRLADGELTIDVSDDGLGAESPRDPGHQGRGLIGMRERVTLFGGQFRAGPRPQGGFEVQARIPVEVAG